MGSISSFVWLGVAVVATAVPSVGRWLAGWIHDVRVQHG